MAAPEYEPNPVDTSNVELSEDLRAKVEALARNNHDVWARGRELEGWKYGPARNDKAKEHPGLVPYDQLPESEKNVDRATVLQTLKAAIALGFEIRATHTRPHGASALDDMQYWPAWPPGLSSDAVLNLSETKAKMVQGYEVADAKAQSHLRWHRRASWATALLGTYAILLAVWQLFDPKAGLLPQVLEIFTVTVALLAVIVGVWATFMKEWLVQRHRAERLRFLKFEFLLDVALAERNHDRLVRSAHKFSSAVDEIGLVEEESVEQWLDEDRVLSDPPAAGESEVVSADVRALAGQYKEKRLQIQSRYFFKQASRNTRLNWHSQNIPPLFFLASIFFAMAHFGLERYHASESIRLLLLLAAGLPIIGAGVRAIRSTGEYSRNTLRFRAKHNALNRLIEQLDSALLGQPQAADLVRALWKGEQILEEEHREWLRLMMETEWIG